MKRKSYIPFTAYLLGVAALFFVGIIIAINVLLFNQYTTTMWNRQLENTMESLSVSANQISQMMRNARISTASLLKDDHVESYLYDDYQFEWQDILAYRGAQSRIIDTIHESPSLEGILLLREDGKICGYHPRYSFPGKEEVPSIFEEEVIRKIQQSKGVYWDVIYNQSSINGSWQKDVLILGVSKGEYFISYEEMPKSFTAVSLVDPREILSCFDYLSSANSEVCLINGEGECILSQDRTQQGKKQSFASCIDADKNEGYAHCESEEMGMYDLAYHRVPSTEWYLVKTSSAAAFQGDLKDLRQHILWIALVLLMVTMACYALWSKRVTQSLERMSTAMKKMRDGNLSLRITEPMTIREYEDIRLQFNSMADSIQRLLAEAKQMERERVALEARAIQTQLSPHMIFNSISAIRWMATVLGVEKISEMLSALAELLRPVFREWRLTWSLREEIAHLDHYILLLKLRCGDTLDMQMNIPEEMLDETIPCFLFQPILENCFEHGIRKLERITVTVNARQEKNGMMYIVITDDGGGIEPEKLQKLRERLEQTEDEPYENHGIGLYSVHRKLQLLCGSQSGLKIESTLNEGTVITLCIQKQKSIDP